MTKKLKRPPGFVVQESEEAFRTSDLLGDDITPESVRRALTLISHSVTSILIIDEFVRVEKPVKRQMADAIKTLSDHSVGVTVILVGVADSVDELIEEHESVERALVQIHMPRMGETEIGDIVDRGFKMLDLEITGSARSRIIQLSQAVAHYTHLISYNSAERAFEQNLETVDSDIVNYAIQISISTAQQSIKSLWHRASRAVRGRTICSRRS